MAAWDEHDLKRLARQTQHVRRCRLVSAPVPAPTHDTSVELGISPVGRQVSVGGRAAAAATPAPSRSSGARRDSGLVGPISVTSGSSPQRKPHAIKRTSNVPTERMTASQTVGDICCAQSMP